jgi:2-dehydro-3-deoxy-D-arabinonate dehydratase
LFRALHFPVGFVLMSGTSMVPPAEFTLMLGDTVRISVPGVGTLTNHVGELGKNDSREAEAAVARRLPTHAIRETL